MAMDSETLSECRRLEKTLYGVFAEEEVVALVVGDDEGREVLDLYTANRLHAQFVVLYGLYALDALLGQASGGTANAALVETTMIFAGLDDHLGEVQISQSLRTFPQALPIGRTPQQSGNQG